MTPRSTLFSIAWACWPCALMLGWIVYAVLAG